MPNITLFDNTVGLLKKVLDLRLQNQQVIAANIANAETPGFVPARLDFEKSLQAATGNAGMRPVRTNAGHIPLRAGGGDDVQAEIIRTPEQSLTGDGNGVNVEQEMIALSKNQILYEATTQMMKKKLGLLKYVVQSGR